MHEQPIISYLHAPNPPTGGQPLASPKTNVVIEDPAQAALVPNLLIRRFAREYKEAKAN